MNKSGRPTVHVLPQPGSPVEPFPTDNDATASHDPANLLMLRQIAEKIESAVTMLLKFDQARRCHIVQAADTLVNCFQLGGKVLVAGNGGSASEAQHFAGELVGRFYQDREPLPVIALNCNSSVLTAIANDYGYEHVFSRQLRALGNSRDLLVAISTSGNSPNIIAAVREAKSKGMKTIGFLSDRPGELTSMVDIPLLVPATDTPSIQEGHIMLTHLLCSLVEQALWANGQASSTTPASDTVRAAHIKDTCMTRAIFLDRDGTLIEDMKYQFEPDGLRLLGGVTSGLRSLRAAGYKLIVITNQSGVARGLFGEDEVRTINAHLANTLAAEGIDIDAFYYCPHHVDGTIPEYSVDCECRKPKPGLILRAASDWQLDLTNSWVIGDIYDDVEAGQRAGCRTVLIDAAGTEGAPRNGCVPTYTTRDFHQAAISILNHRQGEADG